MIDIIFLYILLILWCTVAQLIARQTGNRRILSAAESHCAASLSKTLYPLLSTGSTQEDRKSSQNDSFCSRWQSEFSISPFEIKRQESFISSYESERTCNSLAVFWLTMNLDEI